MNESNYDPKTENDVFNSDTTFSQKRFGELVTKVNNLENSISNSQNNEENNSNIEYKLSAGSLDDTEGIILSKTDNTNASIVSIYSNDQIRIDVNSNTYVPGLTINTTQVGYPGGPMHSAIEIELAADFVSIIRNMYEDIQTLKSKVQ